MFIPAGEGEVITDFAWVSTSLQYLFIRVPLHDRGTKGKLLESLAGGKESVLPDGECKGFDGTSKEVDAAIRIGQCVVLVECKANARSIAFDRGDLTALKYRNRAIEEALHQIDDKAKWFSNHPKGTNYNLGGVQVILPIVVTPFKEFIPSLHDRFWVERGLPRILAPAELNELLKRADLEALGRNCRSSVYIPTVLETENDAR